MIRRLLCRASIVAALAGTQNLAAQDSPALGWTDHQFEFALGGTSLLKASVRSAVFDDVSVRAGLRRAGVASACPTVHEAIDAVLAAHEAEYREWAMPALREIITPEEESKPAGSISPSGFHEALGRRLLNRLRRDRPEFLPMITNEALTRTTEALTGLPPASADWRARFADWDFEKGPGLQYRIACLVETSGNPDNGKLAFDGFYKIRGS